MKMEKSYLIKKYLGRKVGKNQVRFATDHAKKDFLHELNFYLPVRKERDRRSDMRRASQG